MARCDAGTEAGSGVFVEEGTTAPPSLTGRVPDVLKVVRCVPIESTTTATSMMPLTYCR